MSRLAQAVDCIRPKVGGGELLRMFWAGLRRHRLSFGLLVAFWIVFATFTHYFYISYQGTPSMPYHWYVVSRTPPTPQSLKRGDIVVWRWWGGLGWPKNAMFVKFIAGMPGDPVKRIGRQFYVDGKYVGTALTYDQRMHVPLEANTAGRVPPGHYYMFAPAPDSLDSRYKKTGYVPYGRIVGRAYVIY